jgi:hypothetical protein
MMGDETALRNEFALCGTKMWPRNIPILCKYSFAFGALPWITVIKKGMDELVVL